ncbi:MAG: PTS sugar transporter subunit IIC [Desulfuromonas sp.]|nr:PTS sugar transporter subunit IIC [Desulfuromonas sp.]
MNLANWLMVAAVSTVAGLDRTAMASVMLARPLVCAALMGYLLDIFVPALQLGIMLELLWLMRLPVGAAVAPDDTQAAIGAVVLIKLFAVHLPEHHWELVVSVGLLVVVFAEIGKCFDVWARHINERLFLHAQRNLERGCWRSLVANHYCGLLVFAVASLASSGFIIASGNFILNIGLGYIDEIAFLFPVDGRMLAAIFPITGIAATLAVIRGRHTVALFVASFAVTYAILEIV